MNNNNNNSNNNNNNNLKIIIVNSILFEMNIESFFLSKF